MGERRDKHRVFVGRTEGKRTRSRPRRRWEKKIKWIFPKCDGESWNGLIWLRTGTGGEHLRMRL